MIPLADIVQRLKNDEAIATEVFHNGNILVADYDIRRDKNKAYFNQLTGDIYPCLVVDDAGELPVFGTHATATQDIFQVWIFAPETANGRATVRTLVDLVIQSLHGWITPTQQRIQYTRQRLGGQTADVSDGAMDRLIFSAVGVRTLTNV